MTFWKRLKNIWKLSEIIPTEESLIVQGILNQFSKKAKIIDTSNPIDEIEI